MIDISITPSDYQQLWWKEVFDKLPIVFTMNELHKLLLTYGVDYNYGNLSRDAKKYMKIEAVPGVALRSTKGGRPPALYRRVL